MILHVSDMLRLVLKFRQEDSACMKQLSIWVGGRCWMRIGRKGWLRVGVES